MPTYASRMTYRGDNADKEIESLLEALPEPSLIVADGRIVLSNQAARVLLGDRIGGADVRLVLRHPAAVERLVGDGLLDAQTVEVAGIAGPERQWTLLIVPLVGDRRFVRLLDRSELAAAERMRVDFVANASHELRTPLATLVGYAETLRDLAGEIDEATRARFNAILHDEAVRMQRLVENLISLSRIEGEKFSPVAEAVELEWLFRETRKACQNAASSGSCNMEIEISPGAGAVAGDRTQLLQLYENLVLNAVRYGRPGGRIRIGAEPLAGGMVATFVSDEGEGIPKEHIPRLTERFYRVDPSRSRAQAGTGLGLSIVKHIVERHRGRLEIDSEVGVGTTVRVTLPAA
jgi:two-component system phosphate regulon sensor histidine kinase PhoR